MQDHQESPPGLEYDTSAPVLVTGATGYVAGWLTRRLLEEGFSVHAAVRNPGIANQMTHIERMRRELPGSIQFFQADLLERGSYTRAMKDCSVVFHTASPFEFAVRDPQRELIDPAVLGTRSVLDSVNVTGSVRRVVLTSSVVATYGDNADIAKLPGKVLNEEAWNTTSTPKHQPYPYSKTQAERIAWEIAEAQDRWRLVTVNPGLVLGPCVTDYIPDAYSFSLIKKFADGTLKAGVPPYETGMVDVRDVAEAHLRAGFLPGAQGRHIIFSDVKRFIDVSALLHAMFKDHRPFPHRVLPKWLLWLVGPRADKAFTRPVVSKNMRHPWRADNSKSRQSLGMQYRAIEQAITDMFSQMIELGAVQVPQALTGSHKPGTS
ncbi:MAG: NAD-dependent epimerase/dehydratase family protein [Proteobacteria bacterium]|nr:NAD-dependent epimerase/dehydratase family protein [Pseudomonadota bacterium]